MELWPIVSWIINVLVLVVGGLMVVGLAGMALTGLMVVFYDIQEWLRDKKEQKANRAKISLTGGGDPPTTSEQEN